MKCFSSLFLPAAASLLSVLLLTACGVQNTAPETSEVQESPAVVSQTKAGSFSIISQDEAKQMMQKEDGHIVLDVRRIDEYNSGHIPGAVCIPNETIETTPPAGLPDLDQIILIYCRSGNRSKQAAQKLSDMGYTHLYEFGGIIDWTGEITEPST